jgi:Protein of unknown function (DUF2568)
MDAANRKRTRATLAAHATRPDREKSLTLPTRKALTLALRVLMEAGIIAAFAWWGYQAGAGTGMKILLAAGAPALGFGFWGAIDFGQAGRLAEPLRLLQELAVSGLAAAALYTAGQHLLGWALGLLTIIYHALVYLQGERLLKHHGASITKTSGAVCVQDAASEWPPAARRRFRGGYHRVRLTRPARQAPSSHGASDIR